MLTLTRFSLQTVQPDVTLALNFRLLMSRSFGSFWSTENTLKPEAFFMDMGKAQKSSQ
jgi:hypothetical protein